MAPKEIKAKIFSVEAAPAAAAVDDEAEGGGFFPTVSVIVVALDCAPTESTAAY